MSETPAIEMAARAIGDVRRRYRVGTWGDVAISLEWVVNLLDERETQVFKGTRQECEHWIDQQAARACVTAYLEAIPVTEGMVEDGICSHCGAPPRTDCRAAQAQLDTCLWAEDAAALRHAAREGGGL